MELENLKKGSLFEEIKKMQAEIKINQSEINILCPQTKKEPKNNNQLYV